MGQFNWESSNSKTAFPFERVKDELKPVFVDALAIDGDAVQDRLLVKSLEINDVSSTIDVVYKGSDVPFFIYPTTTFIRKYDNWILIRWEQLQDGKQLMLLLDANSVSIPSTISGINGTLVARAHELTPKSVRRIKFVDKDGATHIVSEDIKLVSGYNMSIVEEEQAAIFDTAEANRAAQTISINAIAGSGAGRLPNDCTDNVLRTINGVGPDDTGNLKLSAINCYRAGIPILSSTPTSAVLELNALQFANTCEACCECADYGNVYKALDRLYNRGRDAGRALQQVNQAYQGANNTANFQKIKREKAKFDVQLFPGPGYVLGILITALNSTKSDETLIDHQFRIELVAKNPIPVTPAVVADPRAFIIKKNIFIMNEELGTEWLPLTIAEAFPIDKILPDYTLNVQKHSNVRKRTFAAIWHQLQFKEDGGSDDLFDNFPVEVTVRSIDSFWEAPDETNEVVEEIQLRKELQDTSP